MAKKSETPYDRYNAKRVQVCQIKVVEGSDEQEEIELALKWAKDNHGYGNTREVFVDSLLRRYRRSIKP